VNCTRGEVPCQLRQQEMGPEEVSALFFQGNGRATRVERGAMGW